MKQDVKEKLIDLVASVAEELASLSSERERMESLKDFNRVVHLIQPIANGVIMEEDEDKRAFILQKFKENLAKIRPQL